jgi:hypothetical protein
MRIKILAIGAVMAAVIGGGTASAALQNQLNVDILQKAQGKPATVKVYAQNYDSAGKVPERISQVVLKSKSAKWNGKAVTKCTSPIPDKNLPAGPITPACPSKSLIGTGTAVALAGNAGEAVPPQGGANYITSKLKFYNYKPQSGAKVSILIEAVSDQPIPDATIYMTANVDSKGTLTAKIPNVSDIPTNLAQFYPNKNINIIEFKSTLNPKRTKLFMLKKGNLNAELTVTRE